MKFLSVSLALAACLSMAAAQGLNGLPDCAKACATNSIPANCGLDVKCICSDPSFITGISCCISKSCALDQQQAAVQFADQICKTAGVTNLPQSASCPSATAGTSSNSSTTTSGSSTATSGTTTQTAANATTSTTGSVTSSATSAAHTSVGAAVAQYKDVGLAVVAGAAAAAFGLLI